MSLQGSDKIIHLLKMFKCFYKLKIKFGKKCLVTRCTFAQLSHNKKCNRCQKVYGKMLVLDLKAVNKLIDSKK